MTFANFVFTSLRYVFDPPHQSVAPHCAIINKNNTKKFKLNRSSKNINLIAAVWFYPNKCIKLSQYTTYHKVLAHLQTDSDQVKSEFS